MDWSKLTDDQARTVASLQLAFYRLGPPNEADREKIIKRLDAIYPAKRREANVMLTELMCYLQAPSAAEKGIKLLEEAPTQEGQIDLVRSLRFLETGWTLETRRKLFEWLTRAAAYKGANNFANFHDRVEDRCARPVAEKDRAALERRHRCARAEAMSRRLRPRPGRSSRNGPWPNCDRSSKRS